MFDSSLPTSLVFTETQANEEPQCRGKRRNLSSPIDAAF